MISGDDPRSEIGRWAERWECEPPPPGMSYQILDDEWDATVDPPIRTIKRIRILDGNGHVVATPPSEDPAK